MENLKSGNIVQDGNEKVKKERKWWKNPKSTTRNAKLVDPTYAFVDLSS